MILGDLDNWEQAWFSPSLRKAVAYIRQTDLKSLQTGRYEIDGDNMFALIQEFSTADKSQRKAECHSKYIDLQYLIHGPEEILFVARPSDKNVIVENELETKDYALFEKVSNESEIHLKPGMFVVLFPSDIHRPGCSGNKPANIKKLVIKIHKEAL